MTLFAKSLAWHPPVGVFIAVLAVVGVLVPWLKEGVNKREKALWTLIMFLLVGLEIRSIYLDQGEHDQQQADARAAQLRSFREIATGIDTAIGTSQRQFGETMTEARKLAAKTSAVASLAKESLENVTGGNSFAFVVPQTHGGDAIEIPLVVHNSGGTVLSGVTVSILRTADGNWVKGLYSPISAGTLAPHGMSFLSKTITPQLQSNGIDHYWIWISAQNGLVQESLEFRRASHGVPWAFQYRVEKQVELPRLKRGESRFKNELLIKPTGWSDDTTVPAVVKRRH